MKYKNKYIIKYKKYKFLFYTDKTVKLNYGDIIFVKGKIEMANSARNFELFDYSRYLRQNKIYGVLNSQDFIKIGEEKDIFYYIEILKLKLKNNIFFLFDKEKSGFLIGLLLGDKTEIFDETEEMFRNSSLSHILALSGLHIIYVSFCIKFLLNIIFKSQRLKNIFMICFLIFFAIFTGSSPSCLRACIMSSIVYFSKLVFRKDDFFTSLLISLDVILIINCYNIENIGMWLSILATFGIFYIKFNSAIACNLMVFPIVWNWYNKFSLTFFVSNFFASILIGPIIILGYIHLIFGKLSAYFSMFEVSFIDILFYISKNISDWKISKIFVPSLDIKIWIIYYIFIFGSIYLYYHKEIYYKYKTKIKCVLFVLFIVVFILFIPKRKGFSLHFLDVGQGDCSLMITPFGKSILIDGGDNENYDNGKNIVTPYLLKNGITRINYLIISHRRFRPYWRIVLYIGKYKG